MTWVHRHAIPLAVLGVMVLGLLVRLPEPAQGLAADEALWLARASDLAMQLGWLELPTAQPYLMGLDDRRHVDLGGLTIKAHHPGHVTAFLYAAGLAIGQVGPNDQAGFLMMRWLSGVSVVVLGLALMLALHRWGGLSIVQAALPAMILLTAPTLLGESRMLRQDALLTVWVGGAALAAWRAMHTRRTSWLYVSSICGGLAVGTKLFALAPLGALWLGMAVVTQRPLWLGVALAGTALCFLAVSPNLWPDPAAGVRAILALTFGSQEVPGSDHFSLWRWPGNVARTLTAVSPLFVLSLGFAMARWRHLGAPERVLLVTGALVPSLVALSPIPLGRYVLPAWMLILIPAAVALKDWSPRRAGVMLGAVLALHGASFVAWYPYPMLYRWEPLALGGNPLDAPDQLGAALGPQLAADLEQHGIAHVAASAPIPLQLYFQGSVTHHIPDPKRPAVPASWLLLIDQERHHAPACAGSPVQAYRHMGTTHYLLYDAKACPGWNDGG